MNKYLDRDITEFVSDFPLLGELRNKSILITGATGLIGSTLVLCLQGMEEKYKLGINLVCLVRDLPKAKKLFSECNCVKLFKCDLENIQLSANERYDYIIHMASPTSGKFFVEKPVETYRFIQNSTVSLLELAKKMDLDSFVYVSSLESYGIFEEEVAITEDMQGFINPLDVRSSYSMGKRAAESLCYFYFKEYNVPVKIARLTQTFGAGVAENDNRVYAQFARCVVGNKNLELHTAGNSAKPYSYTTDSISAILFILLKGESGNAYNVANEDTYISIRNMAEFLIREFAPNINLIFNIRDDMGYAPQTKLKLSTNRLKNLGWKPKYGLKEMYIRLIESIKENYEGNIVTSD